MESTRAIDALGALAQETRLAVFRLLVAAGPDGMAAGDVATALNVAPGTLSFHLKELSRADLVLSRRQGRQIFYAADYAGMRALLTYLMHDCCGGRVELRGPLPETTAAEAGQ
ncbi:MAG: metalloregulator ArsR/SmtB family transcription factor [Alphaproteobacteria bacterium]|jgi:DNA-binding transcriptional ArsR family regulator|nr:metalloregulator ArsR/SmtB family transcription factor [Alphaproteobacteria bacterium]